jgi:regulation of enolase protein 1 (concanavalin A-like superfamily)
MCRRAVFLSFVLMVGLILASTASAELIGWWRLNEGARYIFTDSSDYGHDGTIEPLNESAVKWAIDGYKGSALQFLTSTAPFTICDANITPGLLNIAESSYSFWSKTPTEYQAWGPALVLIGEQHDSDFELADTGIPFIFSEPEAGGTVSYPGDWSLVSGVTLNDNQWHHITVTCSASQQRIIYYLDGEMEVTSDPNWTLSDPILKVRIGGPRSSSNRRQWRNYIGTLDEVAVFNHSLAADEVASLFKYGPRPTPKATTPSPIENTEDVLQDVILKWEAGIYADKHDVYFGTVFEDINEASIADTRGVLLGQNQDGATFDPPGLLDYGKTYYWRVDEVNDSNPESPWRGDVWSFTSANFIVVDAFESYTDLEPNRIFDAWADGWEIETNGSTIGYSDPDFNIGEHFVESNIVHDGFQSMPFFYDNEGKFSEAVLKLEGAASDWTRQNAESLSLWFLGYPAKVSSFEEAPVGAYTLKGLGLDIWADLDQFHFAYKEVSGSVTIIAKVESVGNTDPFAKAGIMIRNSLEPDAANVAVLVTPENGVRYQYRNTDGGTTDREFDPNVVAPQWVKLQRTSGGLVRASYSADGNTWKNFTLRTITMSMPIYVGLAVTSHTVDTVCEAKFSNVSFPSTTVPSQWIAQDIGVLTNSAESMYVVLNGSTVIYHDVPNASQINTWTEWRIPLQRFADMGVNLRSVNSLGIGFGDRNNPQAGGQGKMYIDDIRLYLPTSTE